MKKKYKLTEETINVNGKTLHRIEALKDFGNVKKGDKGGFIEKRDNLSKNDDCWIFDDAKVYGRAKIYDDAKVYGNAKIYDDAKVYGNAKIYDNAEVCDEARVCVRAVVCGDAFIYGRATIYNDAKVYGNAKIYDNAKVYGNAEVCSNARVYGNARVWGNASIYGNAKVCGYARIRGDASVYGDAKVESASDYIVFKNWWSSGRYFTWTRSNNMWSVGCFYGTGEGLIAKAYRDSELSGREYERVVKYVESILKDNENDKR